MSGLMTEDTWAPHPVCPGAEVRPLEVGGSRAPGLLIPVRLHRALELYGFAVYLWPLERSWGCVDSPATCSPVGRREEGEEGISFDTEEERQQWEDDQRVKT